jgi:hypothetical protein
MTETLTDTTYHKIQSLYKRDESGKMLFGEFSLPEFEYLKDCPWDFTEKVDGTNIRVIVEGGDIRFGGKTDNAQLPAKLVSRLQERFLVNKERVLEQFPDGAVLYGEGYGAGIQKGGGLYRQDQDFVLFDVRIGRWWLNRGAVRDVAGGLDVLVAPALGSGTLSALHKLVGCGVKSWWGDFDAEGIVARPQVELFTRAGHRIITKLKCKDFA